MNLTEEQQAAVNAPGEIVACIAGPGSGKTHLTVERISADFASGRAAPETTAVITFTAAAARELSNRLEAAGVPLPAYVGTLHGWCLKFLNAGRRDPLTVLDEGAAEAMAKFVIERNHLKTTAAKMAKAISGIGLWLVEQHAQQLTLAVSLYRKLLADEGAIDYDLILANTLEALAVTDPGVRALYVDEFQDSSPIDLKIYTALRLNLFFVVGDPDQAIYGFRGGDVAGLLSLVNRPGASVVYLQDCFRCRQGICDLANRLIERNTVRAPKRMRSVKDGDADAILKRFGTDLEERAWIVASIRERLAAVSPTDIAVLVRYNSEREKIVAALDAAGIPVAGKKAPEPPDWRLAVASLNLIAAPTNFMAGVAWHAARGAPLIEAMKTCREMRETGHSYGPEGVGSDTNIAAALKACGVSLESALRIAEISTAVGAKSALDAAYAIRETLKADGPAGVTVTTFHGAKGLEWPEVYLPAFEAGTIPGNKAGIEVEEERRLAFVGLTRAERALRITWAATRGNPYRRNAPEPTGGPSPFVLEIAPAQDVQALAGYVTEKGAGQ